MLAVHFVIDQLLPGPLRAVEDAFVDPAFLARLATLPKLGQPELLDRTDDGPLVHLRVHYQFVGEVSAAVRAVVDPARLGWVEESTLDRASHLTTWTIVPDHYGSLLRCTGTSTLADDDGGGVRRRAEGDIHVPVPLVGGRVERAIVSGLEEHAVLEAEVMAAHLASG